MAEILFHLARYLLKNAGTGRLTYFLLRHGPLFTVGRRRRRRPSSNFRPPKRVLRSEGFGDREAIQLGLSATGGTISAAGLILGLTFLALVLTSAAWWPFKTPWDSQWVFPHLLENLGKYNFFKQLDFWF